MPPPEKTSGGFCLQNFDFVVTYPSEGCVFMKTGLVLEGGAMRGLFSAGVTDVMMENGISFDRLVGVSAGATFGCNY